MYCHIFQMYKHVVSFSKTCVVMSYKCTNMLSHLPNVKFVLSHLTNVHIFCHVLQCANVLLRLKPSLIHFTKCVDTSCKRIVIHINMLL